MKTSSSCNNPARIKLESLQLHHVWVWGPEDPRSWVVFVAHYLQLSWQLGGSSCTNTLGHIFVKWISGKCIAYGQHLPTPTSGIFSGVLHFKEKLAFYFPCLIPGKVHLNLANSHKIVGRSHWCGPWNMPAASFQLRFPPAMGRDGVEARFSPWVPLGLWLNTGRLCVWVWRD